MMHISQILFGQYHIWDIFGLGLKTEKQSFLWKKKLNDVNQGQGTLSAKMGADSLAEITQNIFGRSARLVQKFGISFKKRRKYLPTYHFYGWKYLAETGCC